MVKHAMLFAAMFLVTLRSSKASIDGEPPIAPGRAFRIRENKEVLIKNIETIVKTDNSNDDSKELFMLKDSILTTTKNDDCISRTQVFGSPKNTFIYDLRATNMAMNVIEVSSTVERGSVFSF